MNYMIDEFATKISIALVRKFPNELPPVGVTRYGMKFILSNGLPLVLLLLFGWTMNILQELMICYISFAILRMVSGGYHAKNPEVCLVISTTLLICIAKFGYFLQGYEMIIGTISAILVLIFAPSNIKNQTKILERHFIYLKILSFILVLIGILINDYLISASILVQSLLLISLKGGEEID